MKTIGLIGGMSWESSADYYRIINETVAERLGGLHSARLLLYSVDFEEIEILLRSGDWQRIAVLLIDAARHLEKGGADLLLLGSNTMHRVAGEIQKALGIPLLHIADATSQAIVERKLDVVGLLGTQYVMEQDFYCKRMQQTYGISVLVPDEPDRRLVNSVIFDELCRGIIKDVSRKAFCSVIGKLVARGAKGVVLGCTEIPLLVRPEHVSIPLFNTTELHARWAVEEALRP